jgi:2-methylisocitrate lyase-like PEP mutase family enzyme
MNSKDEKEGSRMAGKKLRELMAKKELVCAPGAYSALTAKLIEEAGFNCAYMSGYCTAAATLALPDLGLLTMTEMLANVRILADAVSIPLIADGDTGYGNPINVVRTVREYEKAGAAAIHIEDQVWPKRCGHMKGKQVIPKGDMAAKVRAAADCRLSEDFVIIARTDALAVEGLESAIDRCHAYAEAGADVLFIDGQHTMEQIEALPRQCPERPALINMGPLTPSLTVEEIGRAGYAIAIFPAVCIGPATLAIQQALKRLWETGTSPITHPDEIMQVFATFNKFMGVPYYNGLEEKYKTGA